jgi:hypothetical protein
MFRGLFDDRDVPLVRPYVRTLRSERLPADATAPSYAARCDACLAEPMVVLWRVLTKVAAAPDIDPPAGAGVLTLDLCGHHADAHESTAIGEGWLVVLDRRQSRADEWRTH